MFRLKKFYKQGMMGENRKPIIVDASVVLKWVLPEEDDTNEAYELADDFFNKRISVFVPAHFHSEVANIAARKVPLLAFSFIHQIINSELRPCQLGLELLNTAFRLMKKYPKISFYDAFYHALAIERRGIFITADQKYYQTVKKEGSILSLKDYSLDEIDK